MAQGLSSLGTAAVGEEIILSPEEEAQLTVPVAPVEQSPLESLSAQELFDFSVQTKGDFSPLQEFRQRKDLWGNQELRQKVADANDLIEKRGFDRSDLSIKNAVKGVWDVAKGIGKYAYSQAASNVGAPLAALVSDVVGGPDVGVELGDISRRQIAEATAATETAVTGLSQMAERGGQKVARGLGLAQPLEDRTPEDRVKALWDAVGKADVLDAAVSGKGAFLGSPLVGKYVVEELEKRGVPVRPEEVSELAAGDPVSFWAFGKAFQGLGKIPVPAPVKAGAAAVGAAAGEVLTKAAGKTVTGAGKAAEVVGKAAQKPSVVTGAAVTGALLTGGNVLSALGGATAIKGGIKLAGRVAAKSGEKLADLGRQVSGATPVRSNLALAARDLGAALPGAAGAVAEGAALDLGIAALTSERPEETAHAAALGTVFGLGKGAVKVGGRVLSGQIVAPRAWGQAEPFAQVSNFPGLADMSAAATTKAAPGVVERVNAIRQALSKTDTEFYLAENAATMEKALTDLGVAPDRAKTVSEQAGFFTGSLPDANGKPRRVVLTRDIDAAPHESFHAIQDVMGESANRQIDNLVKQEYADRWETEGRKYAARLLGITPEQLTKQGGKGGLGVNWREAVVEASGWIRAEVAEKMWQDVNAKFQSQETNLTPPPDAIRAEVARHWKEWQDAGGNWRDVIPAERQETLLTEVSDRYIARELAAENYDAAFKNLGVSLKNKGFLDKLANIAASAITALGGEPLAGRASEFGQVPLRERVVRAVVEQAREVSPTPAPIVEPSVTPLKPVVTPTPAAPPTPTTTPTQRVTEWLDTNAKALPVAERAPAARTLNQAVESGQGVRVSYWGAKGEPGGDPTSLRPERRAQIEAQRDAANKDRQLVTKDFFPYSVTLTSKGPQFIGWSPNNFNANATRLTTWIGANPTAAKNINLPYFLGNEAGQRALQADLQVFVQNQRAGFTGSGKELVVPKDVVAAGFTAPEKTGVQPVSLPQERADLINYLFNLRLPDTPRITRGKLPLGVAGQKISAATEGGRVSEPVQPRVPFKGEKAKALGIEGESIQEVNPLRRAIEKAAKDAGVKPPEFIEAAQRLNVERLADATVAPELAPFGGNVLTLTAGFQPQRGGSSWEVRGTTRTGEKQTIRVQAADMAGARSEAEKTLSRIENVRSAAEPVELSTGMFSPQKVNWEVRGTAKGEKKIIMVSAEDIAGARAEAEKQGLTRIDNVRSAESPVELSTGMFSPPSVDVVRKADPVGWAELTKNYKSDRFGGGLTGAAMDLGASAKSREQIAEWTDAAEHHKKAAKNDIEVGNFTSAMSEASRAQYFREAIETATGEGGSVGFIQKHLDPNYKPPFPKVTVEKK